ncbi:WH1-domain-containing protein, partial [Neolentinus lepideus HHB14362 ss-1]
MPTQSTLSDDDKAKVKSVVPKSNNKIIHAGLARIYYAHPDPNNWSYAGLQGALVATRDTSKNGTIYFRMVDLSGTRGVIWEHETYEGFEYFQDRPFFHSFPGDECMVGFVFADEGEAKVFHKKVTNALSKNKSPSKPKAKSAKSKSKTLGKIDKSMISGPTHGSFIHVAHMGYDAEKGFTSTNVDPSWMAFLDQLQSMGVDRNVIEHDMEFIQKFVRNAQKETAAAPKEKKKAPPPPAPRRNVHAQPEAPSAPPPPPP